MINGRTRGRVVTSLTAAAVVAGCVSAPKYDSLETQYQQLNQSLPGEISSDPVHITKLQGAIKVTENSQLLFPSGGWDMPPARGFGHSDPVASNDTPQGQAQDRRIELTLAAPQPAS